MDLQAGEMAGIRVKGHLDLTLEHFAQRVLIRFLFSWRMAAAEDTVIC